MRLVYYAMIFIWIFCFLLLGSMHVFSHLVKYHSVWFSVSILSSTCLILELYHFMKILFITYLYRIIWKQTKISRPCAVDQLVTILVTFCIRSSIFWALKLIFLILASEDPECAPCPIAWDYTVTPTTEDVEAAAFGHQKWQHQEHQHE